MTPVDSILARLLALHPKRIDLSLDRMRHMLERLGHPERRVPPVIHVAGTNGKGSTIAFLRAMLEAAGKSVHVYTSPNLVRVNERFRLGAPGGGVLVSDDELADALAECERANGDAPITMFEIETAAAFVLFARHPADMLLLEVGLGGRLDATNVIERPLASVVTPVSMDHVEFLGDTIEKIAAEKAGIFRCGVPAVIAPQSDVRVRACWSATPRACARRCMPPASNGPRASSTAASSIRTKRACSTCRRRNCSAAISSTMPAPRSRRCARRACGFPSAAIEQGLMRAEWPARLQRLTTGKLVALAPAGAELWLDGGHNADGGRAIAAALGDLEERVSRPLVLVVGMLTHQGPRGFPGQFHRAGAARVRRADPSGQGRAGRRDRGGRARRPACRRMRARASRMRWRRSAASASTRRRAS